MGRFSKNLGSMAEDIVTESEFITLDQKRRVKAARTMWDTGSNATYFPRLSPENCNLSCSGKEGW